MKHLVGLILALCAGAAQAATWPCLPKEFAGSGTYFTLAETADAYSFGWVCDVNGTPKIFDLTVNKGYVPRATCVGSAPAAAASAAASPTPLATANAMMDQCQDVPVTGSAARAKYDGAFNLMLSLVRAKYAADHPPTGPVYKTPAGGSAIYPVVNGKLGPPTTRRAAGNALCDCVRLKIIVGAYTYCALDGGPSTEAVLAVKAGP